MDCGGEDGKAPGPGAIGRLERPPDRPAEEGTARLRPGGTGGSAG